MRILGLIGSSRAFGNTELLVTEVAKAAVGNDPNTTAHLLRLTDLRLSYCTGCMSCAFNEGSPCPLDDDMEYLLSEYRACDALILGAPAYTLLPPGPLKLVADRLLLQLARSEWLAPKPAVTVGVAGLPRWSELLVPLLNCMVLGQGFRLVDSFLTYGSGPGEVLLDESNLRRAEQAGQRLQRDLSGDRVYMTVEPGCCPICGADFFRFTQMGVECPLCLASGTLNNGVPAFDSMPANRWQPDAMKRHFVEWVQGTSETYLEQRAAIRKRLRACRPRPFQFIRPRAEDSSSRE